MERARSMGVLSADGTFVKYRRRRAASDLHANARDLRGAVELDAWVSWLAANPLLPLQPTETPALAVHRSVLAEGDT
jgi:hypothetical protein